MTNVQARRAHRLLVDEVTPTCA